MALAINPHNFSPYIMSGVLSQSQIEAISDRNGFNIRVLNHHDLSAVKAVNGNYVININPQTQMGHWVAMCITNKRGYYFDSFGVQPSTQIIRWLNRHSVKWTYSTNDIQDMDDQHCGWYCIAFIHFFRYHESIRQFTSMFYNDTDRNVAVLKSYLKAHER